MGLEALPLSCEKSFDLVQSSHELFKCGLHRLSPVAVKNIVGTLLEGIALGLRQIGLLLFFGKTVMRKAGNLSLRQMYTTRAPPLLPIPERDTRTFRNPPVPDITSPHSGSSATMATMSSRSLSLKSLPARAM